LHDLDRVRNEPSPVTSTTPFDDLPQQLTVAEYIAVPRVSRATAYDHIKRNLIPSIRYGRIVRIPKTVLR